MKNNASQIVTEVLFKNDADENASYNIRKDGYVVIQFDSSVSEMKYTRVVDQLRSDCMVTGVWAEQSGEPNPVSGNINFSHQQKENGAAAA